MCHAAAFPSVNATAVPLLIHDKKQPCRLYQWDLTAWVCGCLQIAKQLFGMVPGCSLQYATKVAGPGVVLAGLAGCKGCMKG
jgi:hypothetical protein